MEKILVPTDLTPVAELGLQLAVEIAKRSQAVVSLVNFVRHPFGTTFTATGDINKKVDREADLYTVQLLRANKEKLSDLASKYGAEGVEIEYSIIDDELKDGIDAYLEQEYIDLVVMGTTGEETVQEAFTGNHTEQVIQVSSCPVLSVRDGFTIEDFRNIVLAVSLIRQEQILQALNTLRQLAECFDSHIHLVHVREDNDKTTDQLRLFFHNMAASAGINRFSVSIIEAEDQADGVIQFARRERAGLIAVIKNSKEGLFRIFSNHFSNRLVKEVGRPVFTYNLQNT
jgi:nucleotide-binding universal stress UspA family protein